MSDRLPILRIGDVLLVSLQVDLEDRTVLGLQDGLAREAVSAGARGVVIDISALEIVDSFVGRMLAATAAISRVPSAETVVVGMRPAVAVTLVEPGLPSSAPPRPSRAAWSRTSRTPTCGPCCTSCAEPWAPPQRPAYGWRYPTPTCPAAWSPTR